MTNKETTNVNNKQTAIALGIVALVVSTVLLWVTIHTDKYQTKYMEERERFGRQLYRHKMIGGWLVEYEGKNVIFIDDKEHKWIINR